MSLSSRKLFSAFSSSRDRFLFVGHFACFTALHTNSLTEFLSSFVKFFIPCSTEAIISFTGIVLGVIVTATFYTLPKVHKVPLTEELDYFTINTDNTNIPMRPINSCIGSPCYEISKHLASLLKMLYNKDHTVKNSKEFVDFVTTQRVEKDEQIVSFDVTSLFTSIPVDLALEIVKFELESTDAWSKHTKLTAKQIYDLVKFVLKNSFFVFEGKYYHQISGCAMGSPVSAVIAELVMQRVEKIALETSPVPVRWWKRYVDDSNACLKQADIQAFHNHINTINKNIQFTIEIPEVRNGEQSIAFLDTEVITDSAGLVKVKVFRKNAHTDKYLAFDSHCSKNDKKTVVKTLMDRAKSIPSDNDLKKDEINRVKKVLSLNGYKTAFVDKVCARNTNALNCDGEADKQRGLFFSFKILIFSSKHKLHYN